MLDEEFAIHELKGCFVVVFLIRGKIQVNMLQDPKNTKTAASFVQGLLQKEVQLRIQLI